MFAILADLGNWALLVYLAPLPAAFVWFLWAAHRAPQRDDFDEPYFTRARVINLTAERERRRASFR